MLTIHNLFSPNKREISIQQYNGNHIYELVNKFNPPQLMDCHMRLYQSIKLKKIRLILYQIKQLDLKGQLIKKFLAFFPTDKF